MIVISNSLVLSASVETNENNPLIGWHNLVSIDNVSASSEDADYPITNIANPITSSIAKWKASSAVAQSIEISVDPSIPIDYVGVARHNWGSGQIPITIEGSTNLGVDWFTLVEETLLPDDSPAIFRFEEQTLTNIRIVMGVGESPATIPEAAVVYVGLLLVLERRIYVGHTPIKYGRVSRVVNGKSEGGDFLGRIVLSEETRTGVDMRNITPSWYRTYMDPFIEAAKEVPFFFAWRPGDYPNEVGFAWMTNDPRPTNILPNGMMGIELQMTGIV